MIHLFDTAELDLADRANAEALNSLHRRWEVAAPGFRAAAYARLRKELHAQLQRNHKQETSHA